MPSIRKTGYDFGKMDQSVKERDIKTVISIVRESKLGPSCWAVTQRGR